MERLEQRKEKNVLTEFEEVKAKIHELHRGKEVVPHVLGYLEVFNALPREWDDFVEYCADDLKLNKQDAGGLDDLIIKLLDETLTPDGERKLQEFMTRYEAAEHPQRGEANDH